VQYFLNLVRKVRKLAKLLRVRRYRKALRYGVAAAIEHRDVLRRIKPDLVVDVGANVGQFSLLVKNECPSAQIIAFEPLNDAAAIYRLLFPGDQNVVLHQAAVGPEKGEAEMHVSNSADSSSLLPISKTQTDLFPGTEEVRRETVAVVPLEYYLTGDYSGQCTLLKIDVQGFELDVLRSVSSLNRFFNWVYVEASFLPFYESQALVHDVVAYMLENGYRLVGCYDPTYSKTGSVLQADFLFMRADMSNESSNVY